MAGTPTSALWTLSGANGMSGSPTWLDFSPTSYRPEPRFLHSAVQDAGTHRMIVFAGNSGTSRLGDVWVLEETAGRVVGIELPDPPVRAQLLGFTRPITPNPSRGAAQLSIAVPLTQSVDLSIFDITGRRVAALHQGRLEAGEHSFEWPVPGERGHQVSPGVYFVRFQAKDKLQTLRLLYMR